MKRARSQRFSWPETQNRQSPSVQPSHGTPTRVAGLESLSAAHDLADDLVPRHERELRLRAARRRRCGGRSGRRRTRARGGAPGRVRARGPGARRAAAARPARRAPSRARRDRVGLRGRAQCPWLHARAPTSPRGTPVSLRKRYRGIRHRWLTEPWRMRAKETSIRRDGGASQAARLRSENELGAGRPGAVVPRDDADARARRGLDHPLDLRPVARRVVRRSTTRSSGARPGP